MIDAALLYHEGGHPEKNVPFLWPAKQRPQKEETFSSEGFLTTRAGCTQPDNITIIIAITITRAGRPQPDNREGNESCLAVLNNFYNDGVR